MTEEGVRNISGFNEKAKKEGKKVMPYIIVVVDEMADLMMVSGKQVENYIQRLAQMARAAGIHIIMATQRPSVDVITGTIKANFPTRISFQVTSKIDSRTILGEQGAEQLLGKGDMLFMSSASRMIRIHGPFVSDSEIEKVSTFLRSQGSPTYIDDITKVEDNDSVSEGGIDSSDKDELFNQAVELIKNEGKASTSFLQRKLQIGYNRAARIIDQMEEAKIISPANHTGKREILP
jgi:S-DNA-T family DNA segregation ATPase FtsK/SpoIIIE